MDGKALDAVCKQVYRRFPEVAGCRPRVQAQGVTSRTSGSTKSNFLLIFHGKGITEDGRTLTRTIRVVADEKGKILKVTSSR